MDTKPNLHNDRTKEQELYAPEGYIRPGVQTRQGMQASRASQTRQAAQVSQEVQISQVVQPNPAVLPAPAAQTSATAAKVVKSEQGGSTIICLLYTSYNGSCYNLLCCGLPRAKAPPEQKRAVWR